MAFCTNCGAPLDDDQRFCPNCGTRIDRPPAAPEPPGFDDGPYQAQPMPEEEPVPAPAPGDFGRKVAQFNDTPDTSGDFDEADVRNHKGMAVLSYFWLLVLIPIFAAKDSAFARYHANQGLLLLIWEVIVYVLRKIWWPLGAIGGIFSFILFIIGIVNAANGRAKELPVIGKFRLLK